MAQAANSDDEETGFDDLCSILAEEGGVKGLEFFKVDDFADSGRGLLSLLSRQPSEELFSIPIKYCLTDYNIENHDKLSPIFKKYPKLIESLSTTEASIYPFMLLFFYELKNPSSKFKQIWLKMFPRNLNDFTIAWSDAELKACGILCPIRRLTVEIQVWIKKCYQTLLPIINEFKDIFNSSDSNNGSNKSNKNIEFTEEICEFICMMCRSRGCRLRLNKNNPNQLSHCFVPIGDFGNHKIGANSLTQLKLKQLRSHINNTQNDFISQQSDLMNKKFFEFDFDTQSVIVRSQEFVLANEQICYEYTAAPNWELLANFGFCLPYNPYDRVIVSISFDNLETSQTDSNNKNDGQKIGKRFLKELKVIDEMGVSKFLRKMNDDGTKYSLAIALTLQDPLPQILIAANRLKLLSNEQLDLLTIKDIANMDKLIMKMESNKGDKGNKNDKNASNSSIDLSESGIDSSDIVSLDKLRSLEWIVLKELKPSISQLLANYGTDDPPIDKSELVHEKGVKFVYRSIKQILTKSSLTVAERIHSLSLVMDKASSESEADE